MDLNAYFERINYHGDCYCTNQSLVAIHREQCFHIPFDMLDPHLGTPSKLEPEYIFDILYGTPEEKIPMLAHKVLLIESENQQWLCDTGFGSNGLIDPIPFKLDTVFHQFFDISCFYMRH
jgi:N-hydroxyarylamine O-acetyltransferase